MLIIILSVISIGFRSQQGLVMSPTLYWAVLPLLFEKYSVAITFSVLKNQWFYNKIKGCIFFLQIVAFNNTHFL